MFDHWFLYIAINNQILNADIPSLRKCVLYIVLNFEANCTGVLKWEQYTATKNMQRV